MTPERESQLLDDVGTTMAIVQRIEKSMVTQDMCDTRRATNGLARSNTALSALQGRVWQFVVIIVTATITYIATKIGK